MSLSRIERAIALAVRSHEGRGLEGEFALPYIAHPFEVLMNLNFVGGVTEEEMLCVAMLHDTVECAGSTLTVIGAQFGTRVRDLVGELTRREPTALETEGMTKDEVWQLRSGLLLEEVKNMSPDAQTLKLADRLANLNEAFRSKKGRKLARYLNQTATILEIIPRKRNPGLWDAIQVKLAGKG